MNKEELIGKLQMVYIGDINALNEMIGYYDGLKEVIEMVQQENKELHSKIDKAIEVINKMIYQGYMNDNIQYFATGEKSEFGIRAKAILEILKDSDIDD